MAKCVLITGASRGLGAAAARVFAREGYNVAINYNKSEAEALALCGELSSAGVEALAVRADISSPDEVASMMSAVYDRFGFVDVLVNNAGISLIKLFTDTEEAEWESVIETDLSSVYRCCRGVLPSMIREHRGCIVNVASMWGEVGASCEAVYSAAKAGVIGITKALAKELGPAGVRVNAVSPGVIMTDMMQGFSQEDLDALTQEIPLCRLGTPEEVAEAILFLSSDKAAYITGQILSVNGGMVV